MSAISGASNSPSLFSFLQQLAGTQQTQSQSPLGTAAATGTSPTNNAVNLLTSLASQLQGASQGQHHHHGGGELRSKIETAVTSALQNNNGTQDINTVITNAIKQALDPEDNLDGSASSTAANSTANPNATSTSGAATPGSAHAAFLQLLQSNGVTPQQFNSDLLSAFQSSVGGNAPDYSSAFSSLAPGSLLNVVA
jgi:hypothetical protein